MLLRNLLLPLAVVCIGLGAVLGGRVGQVLLWVGTVLGGVAAVLILIEA
jgi:hypothetical protein